MAGPGGEGAIRDAVLIAGPTASGKSRLAADLAERIGGVVVNADSMQVYSILDLITARPGKDDLARAPHLLYGHVHPATAHSTGAWLRDVERLVAEGAFAGRRPIFVGGTGLYFRALTGGMAEMPAIPAPLRARLRQRMAGEGPEALHADLALRDPAAAAALRPGDRQRILRALEVVEASGRSILDWQAQGARALVDPSSARRLVLDPPRAVLSERIARRFEAMVEAGAREEARAMAALRLDPALPAMKAIGLRELIAAEAGEMQPAQAVARSQIATRQYAKRQATWFRHQLGPEWRRMGFSDAETLLAHASEFLFGKP